MYHANWRKRYACKACGLKVLTLQNYVVHFERTHVWKQHLNRVPNPKIVWLTNEEEEDDGDSSMQIFETIYIKKESD